MDGDGGSKPVEVEVIDIDMDSDDGDEDKDHEHERDRSPSPPVLTMEVSVSTPVTTPSSFFHRSPGSASTTPSTSGAAGATPKTGEKKRKRLSAAESAAYWKGREEKKLKLEEEKAEKARKREEERIKREEEKRIKDEEKRLKDLKRDEEKKLRDQKKLEEQQKKDEEKRKRDEEKRLRDEEKRKAEEEKQKVIQEKEKAKKKQEEIKAKQSQMLLKFLKKSPSNVQQQPRRIVPMKVTPKRVSGQNSSLSTNHENDKDNPSPESNVSDDNMDFDNSFSVLVMPFQIKSGMELAPLVRRKFTSIEKSHLDQYINGQRMLTGFDLKELVPLECNESFLKSIKGGKGRKYPKTLVIQQQREPDPDIEIISENETPNDNIIDHKGAGLIKWRMKLLQFDENKRPPYWGTWKRYSKKVRPRVPLAKDSDLDYEVDSGDEWEDEPEDGEDLDLNSDKDDKDEDKDDEEIEDEEEDGWLVPHGYLSEDEGDLEDKAISKDELKIKEANFYKEIEHKKKNRIALPIIDTDPRDFADLIPRLLFSDRTAMEPKPKPAISKKVQQPGPEIITVI